LSQRFSDSHAGVVVSQCFTTAPGICGFLSLPDNNQSLNMVRCLQGDVAAAVMLASWHGGRTAGLFDKGAAVIAMDSNNVT
jgi:hypothetical protein